MSVGTKMIGIAYPNLRTPQFNITVQTLKRERNQVTKASLGHRVLIREEDSNPSRWRRSMVRVNRTQADGDAGGRWPFEKHADVSAVAGTRALDCGGHIEIVTGCTERSGIVLPGLFCRSPRRGTNMSRREGEDTRTF
jgi:hypothetical protein